MGAPAGWHLKRGVFARFMGVSGASFLWWAILYAQARLALRGDLAFDAVTAVFTLICVVGAIVEGTASVEIGEAYSCDPCQPEK